MTVPRQFKRYLGIARQLLGRGRLPQLLVSVAHKEARSGERLGALREDLHLLLGLCAAWWRGEYRAIGSQALLSVVAGLLYFATPLDALPDWLLGVGLLDDLAVLAWIMRTWKGELDAYRLWREGQAPQHLADIERLPDES